MARNTSKWGMFILLICITRESKPYAEDKADGGSTFYICLRYHLLTALTEPKVLKLLTPMAQLLSSIVKNKGLLVLSLISCLTCSLHAQSFIVNGIKYNVTSTIDMTVEVVNDDSYGGDMTIPESVTNEGVSYAVTSIGERAFSSCDNLTSIILPNSLTTIGENAFYGCSNLTSISIPNSVNFIGDETFWACKKLSTVTLPSSLQSIEYGLFARCESLTSIIIPNSVKSVSKYSFLDCESLKFVSVGKSVQEVNTQAFDGCPVEDVEFHCDEIKVGMFGDYHSAIHKNYKTIKHVTICDGVQKINDWAFRDWGNLETVQMSNTVKTIGRGAFWECKKLVSCNLSNSLTSMGEEAFCYCKSLQSISIPYGIKEIPYRAFEGCESMITILIPNSVTTIEGYAFGACISLTNLSIPNSVTSINGSFWDCSALETISVAADNPIYDSRNNCNCIINTSDNELLQGCKNSVIPNTVKSIAEYAFGGISGLTQLSIPNSVTSIGRRAFQYCGNLEEVAMSDSVKSIGWGAFYECGKLKSFKIPNTLTSISEKTFAECESLTTIVIPQTISSIGEKAFWNCVSVDSIISLIELPFPILDNVFECGIEKRANLYNNPIYVPIGTKKLYEITDGWKQFTDIKEIAIDDNGTQYDDNSEVNDTTDLNGHVIGNIYYNISDENGEYSSAEGCIILRKPTTDEQMNEVVGMDLFGEDIKNNYTGIIFMVQAGSGTIKVNAETVGSMTLKVKIGNNAPATMELEGKMKASFPYTVTEPTYVYIYGGETTLNNARGVRRAEATYNVLKIYGIEWSESETPTHVEAIRETSSTDTPIYNLNGQRVEPTSKGIYIKNGKKVLVK